MSRRRAIAEGDVRGRLSNARKVSRDKPANRIGQRLTTSAGLFLLLISRQRVSRHHVTKQTHRGREDQRSKQQRRAHVQKCCPTQPFMRPQMCVMKMLRPVVRLVQQPITDLILGAQKEREKWQREIVDGYTDHRSDFVSAQRDRKEQRQQRLESEEWREADEGSDGQSARNALGRIFDAAKFPA